jgi:predicted transcriptional regulator
MVRHYRDGRTYREIAAELGCTHHAVKKIHHQGAQQNSSARQRRGSGACQDSCRLSHAAEAGLFADGSAALTTESRSGLSVTAATGCQLRVFRAQRRGLTARALRYSS